jgi:hypothetical protein
MADAITLLRAALVGIPSYGVNLPDSVVQAMPQQVVSIIPQGGPTAPLHMDVDIQTLELRCYGHDSVEALALYRQAFERLQHTYMLEGDDATLLAVTRLSGPIYGVEPEVEWPFVSAMVQVQIRWD